MKVVYHNGNIGTIYFPVGKLKDGGTCQFSTRKCRRECGICYDKKIGCFQKY